MHLHNQYSSLGSDFYRHALPIPVARPQLFLWNRALAEELGLSDLWSRDPQRLAGFFSGNRLLPGSIPIALAYAGHQFGHFVPQLGDGRAHLLGELVDSSGQLRDIQLKGSGRTTFSRNGDGRCALGPAIREFVMGDAMHAFGIPTSRCLAVVTTGEQVLRESWLPGAVVTRVAASHIRVGTFEYFATRRNIAALRDLSKMAIHRHYPDLADAGDERYLLLLQRVIQRQVQLICQWMRVGFIHGVMNTDNTAISGETLDYGPCAMLGSYDPDTVYSSIDVQGRYAFGNQPAIAQWNMARFAETLLPLIDPEEHKALEQAAALVDQFKPDFDRSFNEMMSQKLGLCAPLAADDDLLSRLLQQMHRQVMDYTLTFDLLTRSLVDPQAEQQCRVTLPDWYEAWKHHLNQDSLPHAERARRMRQHNPLVIPRNHQVEDVIQKTLATGDASAVEELLQVIRSPYEMMKQTPRYQTPPADRDKGYQTFCGT